ncbi:MAG: hypothetical protein L3K03_02255 [Thermoplasmata archaeon]|nr:hypothetical protein [Thermoplasmata archaeon]
MAKEPVEPTFFGPLLLAREFAQTVSFYRSVCELPVEGAAPYAKCISKPSSFSIVDGRWWAEVNGSENPFQGESSVSNVVLMIQVENVEEMFQRLTVTGKKFLSPPLVRERLGIRNVFLRDPDGRSVMLTSPLG